MALLTENEHAELWWINKQKQISMNEQVIKFLENALKNNHCLIISSVIEIFNLKDRADFDRHFNETEKRMSKNPTKKREKIIIIKPNTIYSRTRMIENKIKQLAKK